MLERANLHVHLMARMMTMSTVKKPHHPSLPHLCFFFTFFSLVTVIGNQPLVVDRRVKINIGVILKDIDSVPGKIMLSTLNMSLEDIYRTRPEFKTKIVLHPRSSRGGNIVASARSVVDLIKNEQVQAIIGPETSMEAQFAINLGQKSHVPIISFSASSPFLSSLGSDYFIQATQVDSEQLLTIVSLIKTFQWKQIVLVHVDNDFGGGLIPTLTDELQDKGIKIPYRSVIPSSATHVQISNELRNLESMPTRVFIVHMGETLGLRFFSIAKKLGMMSHDHVWVVTNGIGNILNPKHTHFMHGVIGVRTYVPKTPELNLFTLRWKRNIAMDNIDELDPYVTVFHLWAYDAMTALAMAVEKVGRTRFEFEKGGRTDLTKLGISSVGEDLTREMKSSRFEGVSGKFRLVDGQLKSSVVEIIYVNEGGVNVAGFRPPLKDELESKIWPVKKTPKGWVIPPKQRLRALVPVKGGFEKFVNVTCFPELKIVYATGYCIDVFKAVIKSLPYDVKYDFFTLNGCEGNSTDLYDDLITEVQHQRYDVVVGDITIRASRSSKVDFTLPFMGSGVVMIAPIDDKNMKAKWLFMQPLSPRLWIAILCYFVLFAFVIWVLEHPINPHFAGSVEHQVGASLYYSFSTMVFAHSQYMFSNLARCVIIVWLFFVLILTQSYTASFAAILTAKQLEPTVKGINDLPKNANVSFQTGSFVKDFLIQKGFNQTNLRGYSSVEELDDLFSNGTIVAAFDELPYAKTFLNTSNYCSKYMMVPPVYYANGFGFAFPIGSPLVDDFSQKILNLTEGKYEKNETSIEEQWFGNRTCRLDSPNTLSITPSSLELGNFWVLFVITGFVTVFSLIVFMVRFLYQTRLIWLQCDPNVPLHQRVRNLARIFHEARVNPHALREQESLRSSSNVRNVENDDQSPRSPVAITSHTIAATSSQSMTHRWPSRNRGDAF